MDWAASALVALAEAYAAIKSENIPEGLELHVRVAIGLCTRWLDDYRITGCVRQIEGRIHIRKMEEDSYGALHG